MKRALLLICVLAGVASAGPVKPPTGWLADPQAAVSLTQQLGALSHFGGLKSVVTTEAYRAPNGSSLFVTRVVAGTVIDDKVRGPSALDAASLNAAASAELDELRATASRAGTTPTGGGTKMIADAKVLEATAQWQDANVQMSARMLVAADGQQIIAVSGECVLSKDLVKDAVTPCEAALASLDPEIAPDKRVELQITSERPAAPARPSTMQPPSEGSSGPSLADDTHRPTMAPISIPQATKETDRRPIYVGIGLIVLAAIFWWNRKQREKLESDYEERTGDDKPRDRDADDLHAAAEEPADSKGDTKEGKS